MTEFTVSAGAAAFGDGSHPTTAGMLAALDAIDPAAFAPRSACDIGAGSGILSLRMHQKFGCPVVATDIARNAVMTMRENALANGVGDQITVVQADGFDHPDISAHAPYDLITMNILAEPLLALAADAERHLAAGGVLLVSGVLRWQETHIRHSYGQFGLELSARLVMGDWVTLVWQKP